MNKAMEKLRQEIIELFKSYELSLYCSIFCNGKRYHYEHGTETVDDSDVADYLEYYNRDTLSMSFDGDIYDVFNYDLFPSLLEKFDKLLESYGLYYELGNAWNLSLYEN